MKNDGMLPIIRSHVHTVPEQVVLQIQESHSFAVGWWHSVLLTTLPPLSYTRDMQASSDGRTKTSNKIVITTTHLAHPWLNREKYSQLELIMKMRHE